MKKLLRKLYIFTAAFISFYGIMIFFILSSGLTEKLGAHLHVLPSYNGGEVASSVNDSENDDNGNGNLVYPSSSQFEEGSLDLVHYTVHKPVYNAKWQTNSEYWQLILEFRNGPAKVRNIMIYIDLDNFEWETDYKNRGLSPLYEDAENVTFDESHPWDFAVQIADSHGKVFAPGAEFICNAEYYELNDGKTIKIRIPLWNKNLQKVYTSQKTYHYVLAGGYSEYESGNFISLEKLPAVSHGSTKSPEEYNKLIPQVYDILGENNQLGTWNTEIFTKAKLIPVEIEMNPSSGKAGTHIQFQSYNK